MSLVHRRIEEHKCSNRRQRHRQHHEGTVKARVGAQTEKVEDEEQLGQEIEEFTQRLSQDPLTFENRALEVQLEQMKIDYKSLQDGILRVVRRLSLSVLRFMLTCVAMLLCFLCFLSFIYVSFLFSAFTHVFNHTCVVFDSEENLVCTF